MGDPESVLGQPNKYRQTTTPRGVFTVCGFGDCVWLLGVPYLYVANVMLNDLPLALAGCKILG